MKDGIGYWVMTFMHVNGRGGRYGGEYRASKRYPSMPRAQWRRLAAICFAIGAALAAILIGNEGARTLAGAVFGGLIAVAIGMYLIETVWLRRRAHHAVGTAPPPSEPGATGTPTSQADARTRR